MRSLPTLLVALALALTMAQEIAMAQDKGSTPIGRRGYEWQTDQDLEKERHRRALEGLSQLSLDEWKAKALAWLDVDPEGKEALGVPASFRVGEVRAKKTQVTARGEAGDAWTLTYDKRAPRKLVVVLTDVDKTEVECPLKSSAEEMGSHLGVFLLDGVLHCFPHGATGS